MKNKLIESSPDIMSGTPVFAGTRVPAQTLIDYLAAGESLDEFLYDFPIVSRDRAIASDATSTSSIGDDSTRSSGSH